MPESEKALDELVAYLFGESRARATLKELLRHYVKAEINEALGAHALTRQ